MKVTFYAYMLKHPNGTPFYVGKGQGDRCMEHVREARSDVDASKVSNPRKLRTIRQIEAAGGTVIVEKFIAESEDDALAIEVRLLRDMRERYGNAITNLTDGGEGISGFKFSDATKNLMREKGLQRAETMREKAKARWAAWRENGFADEMRQRMRAGRAANGTNMKMRGENNPAYGLGNRGAKHTEATKALMSRKHSGKGNPMYGRVAGPKLFYVPEPIP